MHEVTVGLSDGAGDLDGILALQRQNLEATVGSEVALRDGFVTVRHTREDLQAMHTIAPSVVAKAGDTLVGYALTMPLACGPIVPVLAPLFDKIGELAPALGVALDRVYVMGQVCVAEAHRGRGVFDALYAGHRRLFADRWDLCVTDVALRNGRSLRAHERVGFERLATYTDATDTWAMIGLWLTRGG